MLTRVLACALAFIFLLFPNVCPYFYGIISCVFSSHVTFGVAGAGGRGRGRHRGAEAVGGDPQRGHVLLGLEQDDVDLGGEEAAEHHRAAQTDGDAHGGGLDLPARPEEEWEVVMKMSACAGAPG